jgi:hypothetical protein
VKVRRPRPSGQGVTLDAGALVAADRGDQVFLLRWSSAVAQGRLPTVSASVVAQVWRGADHPRLSRVLAICQVDRLDLTSAKEVGRLLAASGTTDVIDAEVVLGAIRRGDEVWGSDPDDVRQIADAAGRPVQVLSL